MSKEENKAIEWFKLSIKVNYEELKVLQKGEFTGYGTMEDLKKGEICNKKIILNLIEKQQKLLEQKDNKINKYEEMILNINQKSIETKNIVNIIKNKICELWIKCPKNAINGFMIVERKHKIEILSEILKEL